MIANIVYLITVAAVFMTALFTGEALLNIIKYLINRKLSRIKEL